MAYIQLSRGKQALVDEEDFEELNQYKWQYHPKGYAHTSIYLGKIDGKYKTTTMKMHRMILGAPVGMQVDHINHDRLDNRKTNLRLCNQSENSSNRRVHKNNKSGFRGVSAHNPGYIVEIQFMKRRIKIGYFRDPVEAAKAYDKAALKYHGKFANLNFKRA